MNQIRIEELLLMRPKALIIGCTGQDGSHMVKYLLKKGYEVLIASAFAFSLMSVCVKHLGNRLPVAEIVLIRRNFSEAPFGY